MKKVLLRLPKAIASKLRSQKRTKGEKIHETIDKCVSQFYLEVMSPQFRLLAEQGLKNIPSLTLARAQDQAKNMGIRFRETGVKRSPVGTMLSEETVRRLTVIKAWIGAGRQQALEACLAYGLKMLGRPNPYPGDLARVIFPLVVISPEFEMLKLRSIVEDEFS